MAGTKKSTINVWRRIVLAVVFFSIAIGIALHTGWGTISSLGYKAIAWICPVGFLETLLSGSLGVPRAIITFVVIVVLTIVLGRAFCSWVCPVPPLAGFLRPQKKKANDAAKEDAVKECAIEGAPKEEATACTSCASCGSCAPLGGKRDGFRFDTRHWVLIAAIITAAIFGFPVFCLVCPVGLTFATFISIWALFETHVMSWGLLIFPAIIVLEIVVFRKWCHTLCPIGAFLSLVSQANVTLRPRVNAETCLRSTGTDCHVCVDVCPEELDPHSGRIPECTKCGKCVDHCPAHAITMPFLPPKPVAKAEAKASAEAEEKVAE